MDKNALDWSQLPGIADSDQWRGSGNQHMERGLVPAHSIKERANG